MAAVFSRKVAVPHWLGDPPLEIYGRIGKKRKPIPGRKVPVVVSSCGGLTKTRTAGKRVMQADVQRIKDRVAEQADLIDRLQGEIRKAIVGQQEMVSRLLVGLLSGGHILLEGVPGLAKTLAINTLAQALSVRFQRIQFTPDLLPADLVGTMIYVPSDGSFTTRKGPVFANLILADEVNRAPSKVQSALLEAMQEKQVTIGGETYPLEQPFLVLATQNPIEQEGTYPLPEAQVDRFMLKVKITYPKLAEERKVLDMAIDETAPAGSACAPVAGHLCHAGSGSHGLYG